MGPGSRLTIMEFAEWVDGNRHKYPFEPMPVQQPLPELWLQQITPRRRYYFWRTRPRRPAELFQKRVIHDPPKPGPSEVAGTTTTGGGSLGTRRPACAPISSKPPPAQWAGISGRNRSWDKQRPALEFSTAGHGSSRLSFARKRLPTPRKTYPAHWCVERLCRRDSMLPPLSGHGTVDMRICARRQNP